MNVKSESASTGQQPKVSFEAAHATADGLVERVNELARDVEKVAFAIYARSVTAVAGYVAFPLT